MIAAICIKIPSLSHNSANWQLIWFCLRGAHSFKLENPLPHINLEQGLQAFLNEIQHQARVWVAVWTYSAFSYRLNSSLVLIFLLPVAWRVNLWKTTVFAQAACWSLTREGNLQPDNHWPHLCHQGSVCGHKGGWQGFLWYCVLHLRVCFMIAAPR